MYVLRCFVLLISASSHSTCSIAGCAPFQLRASPEIDRKKLYWICWGIVQFQSFHSFAGGASYSPEYYINIRTGIHYFPKGNATVDSGANRFKSGLNRIEEKHDEVVRSGAFSIIYFALFILCSEEVLRSPFVSLFGEQWNSDGGIAQET